MWNYSLLVGAVISIEFDLELTKVKIKRLLHHRSFVSKFAWTMAACLHTDLPNRQTGLLLDGIGRPTINFHDLPDRPYHPDAKVVIPKSDFGVIRLASLWHRYQARYTFHSNCADVLHVIR